MDAPPPPAPAAAKADTALFDSRDRQSVQTGVHAFGAAYRSGGASGVVVAVLDCYQNVGGNTPYLRAESLLVCLSEDAAGMAVLAAIEQRNNWRRPAQYEDDAYGARVQANVVRAGITDPQLANRLLAALNAELMPALTAMYHTQP